MIKEFIEIPTEAEQNAPMDKPREQPEHRRKRRRKKREHSGAFEGQSKAVISTRSVSAGLRQKVILLLALLLSSVKLNEQEVEGEYKWIGTDTISNCAPPTFGALMCRSVCVSVISRAGNWVQFVHKRAAR